MDILSYLMGQNSAIKKGMEVEVVTELPETGKTNVIYLVPKENTEENDIFEEYLYINNEWELIGTTDIDLSGYQTKIDSEHKLSSDLVDDTNNTNKFVTSIEKTTWGNKYDKPLTGIPSTDLSSEVQTSLGKADTALQSETYTGTITSVKMNGTTVASSGEADLGTVITSHQDISGKENITNKVTSLSASSTDTEYPSAKAVYDALGNIGGDEVNFITTSSQNPMIAIGTKKGLYITKDSEIIGQMGTASYQYGFNPIGWFYVPNDITNNTANNSPIIYYTEFKDGELKLVEIKKNTSGAAGISKNTIYTKYYDSLNTAQTISGLKTFSVLPESSVTPTTNNQLVNKSYVDGLVGNINTALSALVTVQGGNN